ncbi:hypothetical protein [Bacillus sp. AFS031507]|uniref:hypothetical protein n=1 Tax=Bacillus sp. AFS031507 TaxID=2033496 RepID=UPI0015D4BDE8|nr:hypothetical protein [Bacillus sp. AFS031507]
MNKLDKFKTVKAKKDIEKKTEFDLFCDDKLVQIVAKNGRAGDLKTMFERWKSNGGKWE